MSYSLTIEPLGQVIAVDEGQTLLDACLRAGIWLPHACGHGLCGTCKVEVVAGDVDHGDASPFALMDFERDAGRTLACTATIAGDCTIEAEIDDDPDARHLPVGDHVGRVVALYDLARDVKGVEIDLPAPGLIFQAGQYINLRVPGLDVARAFSIASPPSQPTRIALQVRLVPDGRATGWIHRELAPGDRVRFSGPFGRFFVRRSAGKPMIFLAGGTGLSSPQSMIQDMLETGCTTPITLIHGVRSLADLYHQDRLAALAAAHANFSYVPVLSAPAPDDVWAGETGMVHEALQRRFGGNFAGHTAYLCGPPPMVEACLRTLMQGRLFERDIHTERFLTRADADAGRVRSPVFRRL